jgi:hypothetical protein
MKTLDILTEDSVLLEKQIWGRRGAKLVRKYRCTSGRRKNRIVATPAQCFAAPNIKARIRMKQLRKRLGAKMMRKAQRTKRVNPASRVLRRLNR